MLTLGNTPVQQDQTAAVPVSLAGLAAAAPQFAMDQALARSHCAAVLAAGNPEFMHLLPVFDNAGIESRRLVRPLDWYLTPRSFADRNAAYVESAQELYGQAANAALEAAGLAAAQIDFLVTVSSTGIATPTMEARVMSQMGFRADARRVPVFGLGCAGGVSGLALAAALARGSPGSNILMVCLEICSLSLRTDRGDKADIVAAALFGDGAAAAVLSTQAVGGETLSVTADAQWTWPETLDIMGWAVDDFGLGVVFDRSIPGFVSEHLPGAFDHCLESLGLEAAEVARFVCHPGGARVIEALEAAIPLAAGALDAERAILRRYGNMSAPTVLFVLEQVVGDRPIAGPMVLSALGPGFTLATLRLDRR